MVPLLRELQILRHVLTDMVREIAGTHLTADGLHP